MSTSLKNLAAMPPPLEKQQLQRRQSKSRLSKQAEVESEDPPLKNQKIPSAEGPIPQTLVEAYDSEDVQNARLAAKLVRSHAMCGDDDTKLSAKVLEKQGSSKNSSQASSLSRDSSTDYTDSTGVNLTEFVTNTLHKNPKDRQMLLELEQILIEFLSDSALTSHKFPQMSSYNRMLVHRVAAYFGLEHNVDQSGTAIVVCKSEQSRIPEVRFRQLILHEMYSDEPRKYLRKGENTAASCEEYGMYLTVRSPDPQAIERKTRSFDEHEDSRRRIVAQDSSSSAEGLIESPMSGTYEMQTQNAAQPWSSTDSSSADGVPAQTHRLGLGPKAGSFGGVPEAYRAGVFRNPPARRSNTDATKEGGMSRQPTIPELTPSVSPSVMLMGVDQVPPGAVFMNQTTGLPLMNPDGTVYRHNPQSGVSFVPMQGSPHRPSTPCAVAQQMKMLSVNDQFSQAQGVFPPVYVMQPTDGSNPAPGAQSFMLPSNYLQSSPVQYSQQYFTPTGYQANAGAYMPAHYTQQAPMFYHVASPTSQPLLVAIPAMSPAMLEQDRCSSGQAMYSYTPPIPGLIDYQSSNGGLLLVQDAEKDAGEKEDAS